MDGNDAQVQLPTRHASKASKNRYRVLLDQIEGGFYVAEVIRDDAGKAVDLRHLAVNDDFERVTGLRDVAGRLSSEVVPNLEDYWLDLHDRVDRTAAPAHMENYNAYTNRWYRVSLSRAGNGDGYLVGVIDDVTERKRREFHAAFLDELNDEVMDLYTPAEIIERVSQRVGEYLLLSRCMVVDVDNRGEVTVSHGWTREDVPILRRRFLLGEYLGDEVTDALRHGETVLIADTGEDERAHARSYADLGIGSVIAVPLHRHGHWTGVLVATASEPRDWPTDEVDLMGEVALRISPRLERARGDEALRISEEKSRTLFDSIDEGFCILEMIFDEAGAPVDYRYVETNAAFQRQTGLSDAVGKRMRELAPDTEERLFEILGRVARTREPMRFETASRTLGRYFEAYAFRIGALEEGQVALLFRDITERKRRESNATFLDRISEEMLSLATPAEITARVGEQVAEYLDLDDWVLVDVDETHGDMVVHHACAGGGAPSLAGPFRLDAVNQDFAETWRRGEVVVLDDTAGDARPDVRHYVECEIGSAVTVPFQGHGRWTGITAATTSGPRQWRQDEIDVLRELSNRTFFSLERARAREEREQNRQRTALLAEASGRLSDSLDREQILSEVARLVVPRIADLCFVDTKAAPGKGSVLRALVVHRDPHKEDLARAMEERYPIAANEASHIAGVANTGVPILVEEVTEEWLAHTARDDGHLDILQRLDLASVIVAPLLVQGRTLGALTLARGSGERRYTQEDLTFASDLAHRIAQAMDNARLYAEQSHVARTLQESLLPSSLPRIPGLQIAARYRPARGTGDVGAGLDVGGDFYDVFHGPTGWTVVVGDVMGKGVEAAQLTAMIRYTIRTAAMNGAPPGQLLRTLNSAMLNQHDDLRFATVALSQVALVDTDNDEDSAGPAGASITLSSGGHPSPLVLRADGTVVEAVSPDALVGVMAWARFEDVRFTLAPGDVLIYYTDGVTETHGTNGELFGADRLRDLVETCDGLSAEEIAERVEHGVDEFRGQYPDRDDVVVLVLKVSATT